jgi:hypothetical protein
MMSRLWARHCLRRKYLHQVRPLRLIMTRGRLSRPGLRGGGSGLGRTVLEVNGDPLDLFCCGAVSVRSGGSWKFCTLPAGTCLVKLIKLDALKGLNTL